MRLWVRERRCAGMATGCRAGLTQCCGRGVRVSQRESVSNHHRRTAVPGSAVRAEVMASRTPQGGRSPSLESAVPGRVQTAQKCFVLQSEVRGTQCSWSNGCAVWLGPKLGGWGPGPGPGHSNAAALPQAVAPGASRTHSGLSCPLHASLPSQFSLFLLLYACSSNHIPGAGDILCPHTDVDHVCSQGCGVCSLLMVGTPRADGSRLGKMAEAGSS